MGRLTDNRERPPDGPGTPSSPSLPADLLAPLGRDAAGGASPTPLQVWIEPLGRHWVVVADGPVNRHTRGDLWDALTGVIGLSGATTSTGDSRVAVDLRRAVLADACDWVALIKAHQRLAGQGRRLFVVAPRGGTDCLKMERLGLSRLLSLIADLAELP